VGVSVALPVGYGASTIFGNLRIKSINFQVVVVYLERDLYYFSIKVGRLNLVSTKEASVSPRRGKACQHASTLGEE